MNVCLVSPQVTVDRLVAVPELDVGEHVGLQMIAACLRQCGHVVQLLEATEQADMEEWVASRVFADTGLVGLSVMSQTYPLSMAIAKAVRKVLRVPVVVGGVLPTILKDRYLTEFDPDCVVDYVLCGDGEYAVVDLTSLLEAGDTVPGASLAEVRGLVWRDGGEVVANPPRPLIRDLDALPVAARDLAPGALRRLNALGGAPALRVITSRGCLGACLFCHISEYCQSANQRPSWRCRSAHAVVDEIAELRDRFGVEHFLLSDDNFFGYGTLGHARALELSALLESRRLRVTFSIQSRAESFDEDVFLALRDAGLVSVDFGVETIMPASSRFLQKRLSLEDLLGALEGMSRVGGVAVGLYLLNIHPLTTVEETYLNYVFLRDVGYFDRGEEQRDKEVFRKLVGSRLEITAHTRMSAAVAALGLLDGTVPGNPVMYRFRFRSTAMASCYHEMAGYVQQHGTSGFADYMESLLLRYLAKGDGT